MRKEENYSKIHNIVHGMTWTMSCLAWQMPNYGMTNEDNYDDICLYIQ